MVWVGGTNRILRSCEYPPTYIKHPVPQFFRPLPLPKEILLIKNSRYIGSLVLKHGKKMDKGVRTIPRKENQVKKIKIKKQHFIDYRTSLMIMILSNIFKLNFGADFLISAINAFTFSLQFDKKAIWQISRKVFLAVFMVTVWTTELTPN